MNSYEKILFDHWGHTSFRPLQLDIIESVAQGKDTLGLLPTGGGKSIIFQVFSLSVPGICLVITPLIALMKDQVENLNSKGIKAISLHSGMTAGEIKVALDNAVWGNYKFLYVSPERLASAAFQERLRQMQVNLITVDEAHCISQWGYDFRPSYLRIAEIRKFFPAIRVLALTATATPKVVGDIQDKLNFPEANVLSVSFSRSNLTYMVRIKEDKLGYLVQTILKAKGSGIVYVRNRKATREIKDLLVKNNITADYYHAGLGNEVRSRKQDAWKRGSIRVIVATNAFGMGIDKPDVRFVIHTDPPDSLEAYFQEAGRAGRDGKKAAAVLLYNNADKLKLKKQLSVQFPSIEFIRKVYDALGNFLQIAVGFGKYQVFDFPMAVFAETYRFQPAQLFHALRLLERQGYIEFTEEIETPSRVYFCVNRDDLYKYQVANAQLDNFAKLLLRSYTGLFTGYVGIDEDLLAKRAGTTSEIIREYLKRLKADKIIDYIPQKRSPYITFSKERLVAERINFTNENYTQRKLDYTARVEAVINYASERMVCRSQLLLSYFGELSSVRCGQCDVCLEQNRLGLSQHSFEEITQSIKKHLNEPMPLDKLLLLLGDNQETQREILRWLIDSKVVVMRVDRLLEWNPTGSEKP